MATNDVNNTWKTKKIIFFLFPFLSLLCACVCVRVCVRVCVYVCACVCVLWHICHIVSSYYYYYYYYYWSSAFTPAFADCFSRESEWQQVSLNLQDSSQYSGRSQQCYSFDGLCSSPTFNFPSLFTKPLEIVPIVHQFQLVSPSPSCSIVFFSFLARSKYLSLFLFPLIFTLWSAETAKVSSWWVLCSLQFFQTRSNCGFFTGIRVTKSFLQDSSKYPNRF